MKKCEIAFGPRRLDRIGLRAPYFRPWGFLGASSGDAFSKACSRAPPSRDPGSHFEFTLKISVEKECLGEDFWHHFPLFFGGLFSSGFFWGEGRGRRQGALAL